jgi:hypothetical protein
MEALSATASRPAIASARTLDQPVVVDGYVIAERGARVSGKVISAERPGASKD